jgi:hypothetical protein
MTWRQRSAALVCVLALCIAPSQVRSQMAGPDDGASGRVFTMTPYAWAAGLKGDVATLSGLPAVEVDASFSDVLDSTDIALMLAGEMRQGKWGLLVDLVYLDLAPQADTRGLFFSGAELQTTTLFATVEGSYRVLEGRPAAVNILLGARPWFLDTELELDPGLLPGRSTADTETWVDPVVGGRVIVDLGAGFSLVGLGDIGGFGVGSDFTWQLLATLDYRVRDWLSVRGGYRHLSVDYEDRGFRFDADMSGPIIGAGFRF